MRRWVCLLPVLVCSAMSVPLQAQDKDKQDKEKKEQRGPIQVAWWGQSFFTITSSKGTVIVNDPHLLFEYERPDNLKADIITISHNHEDHNRLGAVSNYRDKVNCKIIRGINLNDKGKSTDWNIVDEKVKDVRVKSVATYHDSVEGKKYGKNTVFIFEVDGWRIVHLGDLGHQLSPVQVRQIGPVDVLMIPVGGIYTLNAPEAKSVIAQLKPKEYIFPMHYGTKVYKYVLPPEEFLEGIPKKRYVNNFGNQINLTRDPTYKDEEWVSPWRADSDAPRPLVVKMHYYPRK